MANSKSNRRLIVLVPGCLAGNLDLARKISWMAIHDRCNILYLALVDNDEQWPSIQNGVDVMKAVTPQETANASSLIVKTSRWLPALREVYQPGDQLVCHEEQFVSIGFFQTQPITRFLQETMDSPIRPISGFYQTKPVQVEQWLRSMLAWLGFFAILSIFTFLEIRLDMGIHGAVGKLLLCMLLTLEVGSILVWDQFTGNK